MKQKFSKAWAGSRQVRKQRKYRHNAPLHLRHKFLSAHLSAELRKEYGKRSTPVRKGDEVLIMRGSFKGKKGKILGVDLTRSRVSVENMNRQKRDGTKVNVYFNPSGLKILTLNLEDNKRLKRVRKEAKQGKKAGEKTEKNELVKTEKGEKKDAPKKD